MKHIDLSPSVKFKGFVAINGLCYRWARIGYNGLELSATKPEREYLKVIGVDLI